MKFGLTLGSGGAKGLSHIAFLKAMDEMGVRPAVMSGTSIGALIGAFYAAGLKATEIEELFDSLGVRKISRMVDLSIFSNTGLLSGSKVEQFLAENLPVHTFEDLTVPLKVVATRFWEREQTVFDSGSLVKAVRASISIPVVMEPLDLDGTIYTDGGSVNPLPYDLIREECRFLAAIDVSGERTPEDGRRTPTILENIFSTFQIMQASIVSAKMVVSRPDLLIQPELTNVQLLDLHRKDDILEGVRGEVDRFTRELKKALGRQDR